MNKLSLDPGSMKWSIMGSVYNNDYFDNHQTFDGWRKWLEENFETQNGIVRIYCAE